MTDSITVTDNRTGEAVEIPIVDGGISADELRKLIPGIWFNDPSFMTTAVASSAEKRELVEGLGADRGPLRELSVMRAGAGIRRWRECAGRVAGPGAVGRLLFRAGVNG